MRKLLLFCFLLLVSCADPGPPTPAVEDEPPPSPRVVPPTFTPVARVTPAALPTSAVAIAPTAVTGEPTPDFDDPVVELRYAIPALNLERRLMGTVSSRIIMVDETTGVSVEQRNQANNLLVLQQTLADLELSSLPEGCQRCVHFEYTLPLSGVTGSGWLQDPVLLASVENFMTVSLGPHFPPGTAVGLRRSASPFAPAHTIAQTADGRLWRWLATDGEVTEPVEGNPALTALLGAIAIEDLVEEYVVDCQGSPVETLFVGSGEAARQIFIVCPEFALPSTLLPLYLELDAALAPLLAEAALQRPPAALPLAALLDYRRADGTRLTLYQDGTATAIDTDETVYTRTLGVTQVVSLTTTLLESGEVQPGLATFSGNVGDGTTAASTSVLRLRGPNGVYDGEWGNAATVAALADLNTLLDEMVGVVPEEVEEPEAAETVVPEALETGTPEATATATAAP